MAIDPIDGHVDWTASVPTGGAAALASSPAVASDGSAVYVGGSDGMLYAFSANGSPLWTHYTDDYIFSSPAVSATDGTIYITLYGGYEATLRAVNPITGATNWTVATRDISPGGIINGDSSPAIAQDGTIYFLTRSARLYAVHPDGSLAWFFVLPTDDSGEGSPAIDADGNILVGSKDGYLYCISHEGGLRWIFNTSLFNGGTASAINASPSIGPDSTIYIASQDGNIYAITNGGMKWKFTATNSFGGVLPFLASPTVTSSNVVFVGTSDSTGGFYGIADGIQKAPFHSTAANVYSSAAIDPFDGGIIVADMGGYIYKFPGVGDLPANAPWPMFHRTPSHAGAVPDATIVNGGVTAFPNNPTLYPQTGTFTFNLTGTPSIGWEIYASSNLVDWTPIGSALVDKYYTWTDFEDSEIGGVTTRFYQARSPYGCSQIIGFTLQTFGPQSTNLVANPFYQVNDYQFSDTPYPQNTAQGLTTLMADLGFDDLPQGVQIGKWYGTNFDSVTWQLNERSWSSNGDLSLLPGKSFFIINPSTNSITVPFVGNLAPGTSTNRISVGTNYVSALFPKAGRISTDLGFMPNDGDQVILLRTNGSFTSSYSSSTGWSPSEPSIAIAEGFVLNTTQSNTWINYSLSCSSSSNLFIVPAKPVWTDTGLLVTNGDTIVFPAVGAWNGRVDTVGPEGGTTSEDTFVSGPQFSLVAFVGPDPYKDAQGTNRWTENNTYFPLTAEQNGGTNGYWLVGTNGSFTTDRSGKLWFGFNDDGQTTATNDNYGEVYGELQIVHP